MAQKPYQPPCTLTESIVTLVARIAEVVGTLANTPISHDLYLRRVNRIRTIQGSLAIEGNTLDEDQITAILQGKPVIAPERDIKEVRNALKTYDQIANWNPGNDRDLLAAHRALMADLIEDAGTLRRGKVGVMTENHVIHVAPQPARVPQLMQELLHWLASTEMHPLIASAIFHYEFEFIHPFSDGNGRMGRLWQRLILYRWNTLFADIPVESLVYAHQANYYLAIQSSTNQSDAAPFVEFMLERILEAMSVFTLQVTPHVSPHVKRLLHALQGEMSREALQEALALHDRKSFRERYLKPALENGFIEMAIPNKPKSSLQRYRITALGKQCLHQEAEAIRAKLAAKNIDEETISDAVSWSRK